MEFVLVIILIWGCVGMGTAGLCSLKGDKWWHWVIAGPFVWVIYSFDFLKK
jgi:hypothetical protein|tara:strand:- start:1190 stop:1342 length:153 start_codon:yes stop_codon:yes gene_type:complete